MVGKSSMSRSASGSLSDDDGRRPGLGGGLSELSEKRDSSSHGGGGGGAPTATPGMSTVTTDDASASGDNHRPHVGAGTASQGDGHAPC